MFCAEASMGVARVEKRPVSHPAGAGCDVAGQSLDDFSDQRGSEWVCDPGGLEVLPAEQPGSWRPYWEGLLGELGKAVPPEWDVLVLADRGLYARWLWNAIVAWGWHPFLRINVGSKARVPGEENFEWISRWIPTPGTSWQGKVACFCQQKRTGEWNLADALGARLCISMDHPDRPGT